MAGMAMGPGTGMSPPMERDNDMDERPLTPPRRPPGRPFGGGRSMLPPRAGAKRTQTFRGTGGRY